MYNADSYFKMGSSHKVCEDFALHGSFESSSGDPVYYGIVSDGCSSSMIENGIRLPVNVDTGARLWCLVAEQAIKETIYTFGSTDFLFSLKTTILRKMNILVCNLDIPLPALDCTLLIAIVYKNNFFYAVWGDGIVIGRYDKFVGVSVIEYESGAPYYLSYELDRKRSLQYFEQFGDYKQKVKSYAFKINEESSFEELTREENDLYPHASFFDNIKIRKEDCPKGYISVISDGAMSFRQKIEGQYERKVLSLEDLLPHLAYFKGVRGNFLGRSMNLLDRWMKKEHIDHYDDLSIATVAQLPPPKDNKNATK